MRYNYLYHTCLFVAVLFLYCACSDEQLVTSELEPVDLGEVITVGAGVEGLEVSSAITRAAGEKKDAETVDWLVQPLMQGLDITYGNFNGNGNKINEHVAILKLLPNNGEGGAYPYKTNATSGYAEYSFKYRSETDGSETGDLARWYDNGLHYFEGVHVPNRIRFSSDVSELKQDKPNSSDIVFAKVTNLTTDQSADISTGTDNELSNYYLLSHYLGMPANTKIAATVERIKLPFRHRLARVLAYILIDPGLQTNGVPAKIQGYANINADDTTKPFMDDPSSSSIRFCNVDVLEGVHDVYNSTTKVHTLTPKWAEKVRKVVPHFSEQLTSFKTYESEKKTYYEGGSGFPSSCPSGFKEVVYQNVPVYDLIVRPTYTSKDNVMYDEDLTGTSATEYAKKENQIEFTVSLDNGLTYEKPVKIDLDANYQTIIYLKITRDGVDYNESGSALWVESKNNDQWYGVDNKNGQTLSKAGSSWQRAYYNTGLVKDKTNPSDDKITDGGFYDETKGGEDGTSGQYITDATWIKYFAQAYKGGAHHGDYFVLAKDITIDARSLPDDFVFTGHLDGFTTHPESGYHTITITNTGKNWKEYIPTTDYTSGIDRYDSKPEEYSDETGHVFSLPESLYSLTIVRYDEDEIATACAYFDRPFDENDTNYEAMRKIVNSHPEYIKELVYNKVNPTLSEVMSSESDYYVRSGSEGDYTYTKYNKPAVLYTMKQHTSGSVLFSGLDGIYTTAQEEASNTDRYSVQWEANVHLERGYWIPYRDIGEGSTNTGWRAEVMNLKVNGCKLFKEDADITGNVQNCQYIIDGVTNLVNDHIPAYPKYK